MTTSTTTTTTVTDGGVKSTLRATFFDGRAGGCATLSPNAAVVACVSNGTVVDFVQVADVMSELPSSTPAYHVAGRYVALDDVSDLVWAPDSTLLAVWMERRRTIEVVSCLSFAGVARIDGGLNGVQQISWHPSSRCLYWFGLAQSHAVDLTTGTVMVFEQPVKIVTHPRRIATWFMRRRSMTAAVEARRDTAAPTAPRVVALLKAAHDAAYVFTVSPRLASKRPFTEADDFMAAAQRIDDAASDESLTVSLEHFNVYDSATHELLASFPVRWPASADEAIDETGVMHSVSDFAVASSCIILHDHVHMRILCVSLDGLVTLHDMRDAAAFEVSPKRDTVVCLNATSGTLALWMCCADSLYRLRDVPLQPAFFSDTVTVFTEVQTIADPPGEERDGGSVPRSRYTCSRGSDVDLASFREYTAAALARRPYESILSQAFDNARARHGENRHDKNDPSTQVLDPVTAVLTASVFIDFDPTGSYVALVAPHLPSSLLIVDVLRAQVHSVHRHVAPVFALSWCPTSVQAYDDFKEPSGRTEPMLAIVTDSRASTVFVWTPRSAMCLSAPTVATGYAFTRVVWGTNGSSLLLADDLQERFTLCSLHNAQT